jgi:LCP family protein required for cell wall assembly
MTRAGLLTSIRRSALLAAVLSAIVPGLGQLWAGAARRSLVVAAPFLILLVIGSLATIALAGGGLDDETIAGYLLRSDVLLAILVADLALLGYRTLAAVDAWRVTRRRWPDHGGVIGRSVSAGLLGALILANVAVHGGVAYLDVELADVSGTVLAGDDPNDGLLPPGDPEGFADLEVSAEPSPDPPATPTPTPYAGVEESPGHVDTAKPTPTPTPAWRDERLDVLLLGVDSGPGRWSLRTDTMILVSVDVRTARVAMFGIPRNMVNVPLPKESAGAFSCRCYPRLLNSLYVYAMGHPGAFPGGKNRGFRAVAGAIESLTGRKLDGVAIIDLNGFVTLVDSLGGLRITVPRAIYDRSYPKPNGTGSIELYIKAGRQKMDGFRALAYARSRHSSSDYSRMRRQQDVLVALQKQLKPCKILANPTRFLKALKKTVRTSFTADDLPFLLRLAARVNPNKIEHYSLAPPRYPEYLSRADWKRIRTLVRDVFGKKAAKASASPGSTIVPGPTADPIEDPCA